MDKIIKIFEANDKIDSYTYPIVKILMCIVIYVVLLNRNKIFHFSGKTISVLVTVLGLVITMATIYCIYISVIEIMELHYRRVDDQHVIVDMKTKLYPIEDVVEWIESNDILELEIKVREEKIKIGCTSDNKWSTNEFFDKVYYFNDTEYKSIEEFKKVLNTYVTDENLEVISIDGINQ